MTEEEDRARIEAALAGLCGSFETDGYTMSVSGFHEGRLDLAIAAHEGSCPDCLVPHTMMAGLVRAQLPKEVAVSEIAIKYPSAHA